MPKRNLGRNKFLKEKKNKGGESTHKHCNMDKKKMQEHINKTKKLFQNG